MIFDARRVLAASAAALALATAAAVGVELSAPAPTADAALGTDDVFARGLQEREHSPLRWTGERAVFRFRHLPSGPVIVSVSVQGHRDWVAVMADGRSLGTVPPSGFPEYAFQATVPEGRDALDVELRVRPFTAKDGRRLGTQIGRVTVTSARPARVHLAVVGAFVLPALVAALAALGCGGGVLGAAALAALVAAVEAALLRPWGIVHSPYTTSLALLLAGGLLVVAGLARLAERRGPGSGAWALAAGTVALLVQGAAATWPAMLVSDVYLNVHKLQEVAAGNWFIISRTQHQPPFAFPYGVSFYAVLLPFLRMGADPATLVRAGAAAAGLAGSAGLFCLLAPRSARAAGAAVLALQLLPETFDRYSYGNLPNVFGQAMTVLFVAWWSRRAPGGPLVGALLLVLAGLGHLSSAIVLAALLVALALVTRGGGELPGAARAGVVAGALLVGAYYGRFLFMPTIAAQVSRLGEGGSTGTSHAFLDVLGGQLTAAFWGLGLPALALAWHGRPRGREGLDGALQAFWWAGAALAMLAVVSPLEVRYLYALTLPVAAAAGAGVVAVLERKGPERVTALALVAAQAVLALAHLRYDLVVRYVVP
jgi:hypothetical protein